MVIASLGAALDGQRPGRPKRIGRVMALVGCIAALALMPTDGRVMSGDHPVSRPNIVLILTDDQQAETLAAMPYLTSEPGGHWIKFPRAYLNNPLCCPSRATILSGQYSHHTGVESNQDGALLDDSATIATWLASAGYSTGWIGKYLNGYPFSARQRVPPGWDRWAVPLDVGGEYYGYTLQLNPPDTETHGRAPADYSTDVFAAKAAEFVTTMPEPFFMTVSFFGPHDPYVPAPRHAGVPVDVTLNPAFNEADMSDKPALVSSRQRLDGQTWVAKRMEQKRDSVRAVLSVDEGIKRIVDSLVARGVYDNTVIVFMTDNGYSLGEHRWIGKRCQYEPCVRTPFMIRVPWLDGRTESRLVGNVDLASTFTELAGTKPTIEQDGRSIIRLLHDESIPWRTGLLLRSDDTAGDALRFWGLVTDRWKYVELEKGQRELYDLSVDPYELDNLSGKSAYASVMTSLAAELAALRG